MTVVQDLIARNRAGEAVGLPCFCTANEQVLQAVLAHAVDKGFPTVIEATCNQVNQDGGYTGMRAADFLSWLCSMADKAGVGMDQLILGGDHLGPNPWRSEPIGVAMDKARELVKSYVQAGFQKIHLDASMACGGEPNPTFEQIAERAADLCAVAEAHAPDPDKLIYIIGTEVPTSRRSNVSAPRSRRIATHSQHAGWTPPGRGSFPSSPSRASISAIRRSFPSYRKRHAR